MVLGHDAAELLELEPDEVALIALPSIKLQGAVCWNNLNQGSRAEMNRDGATDQETLRRVSWKLAAAWQWLLTEGLLAPHLGQDHPWYMATEPAFAMADPMLTCPRSAAYRSCVGLSWTRPSPSECFRSFVARSTQPRCSRPCSRSRCGCATCPASR